MNHNRIQTITSKSLDDLLLQAQGSLRSRAIHRLHNGDWEHCHRMLNALTPGTYVRPHRHCDEHQSEAFIVLRGKIAAMIFDDEGSIDFSQSRILTQANGVFGLDIPPRIWHSLVALEDTVIFEVKGHPAGGYIQERDKSFASWSPEEGSAESQEYLHKMESWAHQIQ